MQGYLQAFWAQFNWGSLWEALMRVAGVLLCLTVHETCHGLAALALGDPTAKRMHRLSFNPLRHIDWLGALCMMVCGFGWAKPVPVDMRYFKRPKSGMALTALAGPVSNFLLALMLLFCTTFLKTIDSSWSFMTFLFLTRTAVLSIGMGLFNLIPIPPLDGSKVLFALLPERAYWKLMRYERYGMLVLLAVMCLDIGGNYLSNAIYWVYAWMWGLVF